MPESVLVVVSHIEDRVFVIVAIYDIFEFFYFDFFVVLFYFFLTHSLTHSHDLFSDLHTQSGELVSIDWSGFGVDVWDIFEIFGIL